MNLLCVCMAITGLALSSGCRSARLSAWEKYVNRFDSDETMSIFNNRSDIYHENRYRKLVPHNDACLQILTLHGTEEFSDLFDDLNAMKDLELLVSVK